MVRHLAGVSENLLGFGNSTHLVTKMSEVNGSMWTIKETHKKEIHKGKKRIFPYIWEKKNPLGFPFREYVQDWGDILVASTGSSKHHVHSLSINQSLGPRLMTREAVKCELPVCLVKWKSIVQRVADGSLQTMMGRKSPRLRAIIFESRLLVLTKCLISAKLINIS